MSADPVASIREFNRFYTKKIGILHGRLLQHGFTLAEIRVLWEIAHTEHITAKEIARELGMDTGFLSKLLWRMKEHRIVTTERSEHDARIQHLRLTPKGFSALRTLEQQTSEDVRGMIGHLSRANSTRLVEGMRRIQKLLSLKPEEPWHWMLREPRPGDFGWVIERHGAIYAEEYGWGAELEALVAEVVAQFIRNRNPAREKCWIAEREGERAGCVFLVEKSKTVAQLRLLLVDPAARGSGIGNRLVQECILYARSVGYSRMVLWTQSNLHAAHRIYRSHGFKLVKEEPHESFGAKLTGQYWELDLRGPAK